MKEVYAEVFKVGGKSNSLGRSAEVLADVLVDAARLPELYTCISDEDAWVRMRVIDTLEKVLRVYPDWSKPFVEDMVYNLTLIQQPSIQWHLAQIFRVITLTKNQKDAVLHWLSGLLTDTSVDWIVAANTMETLVQFTNDGEFEKKEMIELLNTQLHHKSKSVVKRARKHLDALVKD